MGEYLLCVEGEVFAPHRVVFFSLRYRSVLPARRHFMSDRPRFAFSAGNG